MATLSSISGSPMCGNPIVVTARAMSINAGTDDVLSFHRLIIEVTANTVTMQFSASVTDGEEVQIDISSALRAVADSTQYTADKTSYSTISYSVTAHDEYRLNGDTHTTAKTSPLTGTAFNGKFSDMERLLSGGSLSRVGRWTRKPKTSPLIVAVGETVPYSTSQSLPPAVTIKAITTEGLQQIGDFSVYALPATELTADRYEFRFINGLGVLDSFSCYALADDTPEMDTTEYSLTTLETFGSMSHGIMSKTNDRDSMKLTSGALTKDWADWFVHEFLRAEHVWLRVYTNTARTASTWLRCNLTADDTIKSVTRTKNSPVTIDFTCTLDITGSSNTAMAV